MEDVRATELTLRALDGYALAATLYEPAAPGGRLVVVNAATAVKRGYYMRFAQYLAGRGLTVLTYDYRGIGGSRPPRLRGFHARMRDWAQQDAAGVLEWAHERWPGRVVVVGHSFGGQALGLLPRPDRMAAALLVGSQSGHWRHWPGWRAPVVALLWHAVLPGLAAACGYFPSWTLRMGEDLPKGVAQEWARWGRLRGYSTDDDGGALAAGYARVCCPIRSYSFSDDTIAPPRAVDALLDFYANARVERRALVPGDVGADRVGHWGFFRERFRDSLWPECAGWLSGLADEHEARP